MSSRATSQYRYSSNGHVQYWQKPRNRRRKKRIARGAFVPTDDQVNAAKDMICGVLKWGKFYAANVRDAAVRLHRRLGKKSYALGNTPRQSQITLEKGLMDLLEAKRIRGDIFGFALA